MLGLALVLGIALIGFVICAITAQNLKQRLATYTAFILLFIVGLVFYLVVCVLQVSSFKYFFAVCALAIPLFGYVIISKKDIEDNSDDDKDGDERTSSTADDSGLKKLLNKQDEARSARVEESKRNAKAEASAILEGQKLDDQQATAAAVTALSDASASSKAKRVNNVNRPKLSLRTAQDSHGCDYGVLDVSDFDDELDNLIDEAPDIDMESAKTLSAQASHAGDSKPKHGAHAKAADLIVDEEDFDLTEIERKADVEEAIDSAKPATNDNIDDEFIEDLDEPVLPQLDEDGTVHFEYDDPSQPYDFVSLGLGAAAAAVNAQDADVESITSDEEVLEEDVDALEESSDLQKSSGMNEAQPKESELSEDESAQRNPIYSATYETYLKKAETLMEHGQYEVAALIFSKASELAPKTALIRKAKFSQMQCLVKAGNIKQAKALATDLRSYKVLTAQENVMLKVVEGLR